MAKKSKNLKFPVVKVKVDGKAKLFAIVKPKIDIRTGIPRRTHDEKQHNDIVPRTGIFTAAQVASDAELIAYLVSIRSGMLREISKESDVALDEEDVNPLQDENEALKAKLAELTAKLEAQASGDDNPDKEEKSKANGKSSKGNTSNKGGE